MRLAKPVPSRLSKAPPRTGCPSSEELAAFIDGRLEGPARERIVEHLASCEDCYTVFTGVVDFQNEEGAGATSEGEGDEDLQASADSDAQAAVVVPFPDRRRVPWHRPMSLAACLLAGVGGAFLLYRYLTIPVEITTTDLVTSFEGKPESLKGKTWFEENVYRGGGEAAGASEFLLGVYWTELRVVVLTGDAETGTEIARKILSLIAETRVDGKTQAARIPGLDPEVIALVRELAERAGAPPPPDLPKLDLAPELGQTAGAPPPLDLLARLDRAEEHIDSYARDLGLYEISFGKWTAAARFAAIAEEPRFFASSSKNRRYLSWLLRRREELSLPEEVVEALQQARTAIRADDGEGLSYTRLASRFEDIIIYYAHLADPLA